MVQKEERKGIGERERTNERERARALKYRKEKLRRQKQRKLLFFSLELLCIFCMLFFLISKRIGAETQSHDKTITISEQNDSNMAFLPVDEDGTLSYDMQEKNNSSEILLVNKENKLPDNYEVELVTLEDGVHQSAKEAYKPLCDMLKDGRREGLVFEVCSAYRSIERQQQLFDEDVNALIRLGYTYSQAYEEVSKETMPPGYSEHATGLAFDIVSHDYQILDEKQSNTTENKWLLQHCAEYGFILRYPKEKEDITKINYEPWHFRYVGIDAAKYIMENQLTLEEYLYDN